VEQPLGVATNRDGHWERSAQGDLAEDNPESPGLILVEPIEDEARFLCLQLVQQLAPGHSSAFGRAATTRSTPTRAELTRSTRAHPFDDVGHASLL
jgi:hypothetical protein